MGATANSSPSVPRTRAVGGAVLAWGERSRSNDNFPRVLLARAASSADRCRPRGANAYSGSNSSSATVAGSATRSESSRTTADRPFPAITCSMSRRYASTSCHVFTARISLSLRSA